MLVGSNLNTGKWESARIRRRKLFGTREVIITSVMIAPVYADLNLKESQIFNLIFMLYVFFLFLTMLFACMSTAGEGGN